MGAVIETPRVLGLDLSLTATGLVLMAGDWDGNWSSIHRGKLEPKIPRDATENERIERIVKISNSVLAFAKDHRPTHLVVEQYAMRSVPGRSHTHAIGELGGLVKAALRHALGLSIVAVAPATARKLLLGKLPPTRAKKGGPKPPKQKDVVFQTLRTMGMPDDWSADQADAFVVANWLLSGLGGYALALPPPPEVPKRRRRAA